VQLVKLSSAMASMKAEQEDKRAQLQAAEAVIAHLQQRREEVESLHAELAYLAERIALMQGLLEVGRSMHHQRHI